VNGHLNILGGGRRASVCVSKINSRAPRTRARMRVHAHARENSGRMLRPAVIVDWIGKACRRSRKCLLMKNRPDAASLFLLRPPDRAVSTFDPEKREKERVAFY